MRELKEKGIIHVIRRPIRADVLPRTGAGGDSESGAEECDECSCRDSSLSACVGTWNSKIRHFGGVPSMLPEVLRRPSQGGIYVHFCKLKATTR